MYSYEYVKDESGKIVDIKVNGKPVKRSYMRGFKKAQEKPYFRLIETPRTFANPYSGVECLLSPLEATVYNFCISWYMRYEAGRESVIQVYDDMKYFLLELNSEAYMDLID
jgi:hypothetical protein